MAKSLRDIALEMDRLADPRTPVHLRSVMKWHRFEKEMPASKRGLREVVRRHSPGESVLLRFLTYNTYLMEAHISLPDPFPDLRLTAKPALHARARELGARLRGSQNNNDDYEESGFDVAALYEVMQDTQRLEIMAAWGATPPQFHFGGTLSSLLTISRSLPITRRERLEFIRKGKAFSIMAVPVIGPTFDISLDADFYAHKGVLLTELDTGFGSIEIFCTHLMFGGGLGKTGEALVNVAVPFGAHISESNENERLAMELEQLDELVAFYREHHNSHNPAIICGDFNIDGSDATKFAEVNRRLGAISMRDAWGGSGNPGDEVPFGNQVAGGQTARNDDSEGPQERDFNNVCVPLTTKTAQGDLFCDDSIATASTSRFVGRFDYLFIEEPTGGLNGHKCNLDVARVRRRGFRRSSASDNQGFLSDHMGLETTLIVSRKT